jgi:hypothetical protein
MPALAGAELAVVVSGDGHLRRLAPRLRPVSGARTKSASGPVSPALLGAISTSHPNVPTT